MKFARTPVAGGSVEPRWAYIFRSGPATDSSPTITITRTSAAYTVVSWDFLEYLCQGRYFANTVPDDLRCAGRRSGHSFAVAD